MLRDRVAELTGVDNDTEQAALKLVEAACWVGLDEIPMSHRGYGAGQLVRHTIEKMGLRAQLAPCKALYQVVECGILLPYSPCVVRDV